MYRTTHRWTTAIAAAALIALPVATSAQPASPQQPPAQQAPPQQPPAHQTTPQKPAQTVPTQPPAMQPAPATLSQPAAGGQRDAAAAKQRLSDARDTLSQLTSLPEAARLQGDARTQVTELISNFNELITTQTDWRSSYTKVDGNLSALLGPESPNETPATSGVTGAVGTSGSATAPLDPGVRAKLAEFRTHLKAFERAAGSAPGAMAPSGATSDPAAPASPAPAATAGATGTTGVMPDSPTTTMAPADQATAAAQVAHSGADKHLDAISAILDQSKTGTLTKTQTAALKKHVAELRQLLQERK